MISSTYRCSGFNIIKTVFKKNFWTTSLTICFKKSTILIIFIYSLARKLTGDNDQQPNSTILLVPEVN